MKKMSLGIFFYLSILSAVTSVAMPSLTETQTLQIRTNFTTFYGKPTWLLVLRDIETGLVSPYVFDIRNKDNYWVAFSFGHFYKITASTLTFGPKAEIQNFCHLENGVLSGVSMYMTLTGVLTPDPKTFQCHVTKYSHFKFPIANPNFN